MPVYPGSDYNPYGPAISMEDPTWSSDQSQVPFDGGWNDQTQVPFPGQVGHRGPEPNAFPGQRGHSGPTPEPHWFSRITPEFENSPPGLPFTGYPNQQGIQAPQPRNPFGPITGEQGEFGQIYGQESPIKSTVLPNPMAPLGSGNDTPWSQNLQSPNTPWTQGISAPVERPNFYVPNAGAAQDLMDMQDPSWSPEASHPPGANGGWDDVQELNAFDAAMESPTKFMPDPRDEQQVFNYTNKLMDDARTEKDKARGQLKQQRLRQQSTLHAMVLTVRWRKDVRSTSLVCRVCSRSRQS